MNIFIRLGGLYQIRAIIVGRGPEGQVDLDEAKTNQHVQPVPNVNILVGSGLVGRE
jgi:hypothetical protein